MPHYLVCGQEIPPSSSFPSHNLFRLLAHMSMASFLMCGLILEKRRREGKERWPLFGSVQASLAPPHHYYHYCHLLSSSPSLYRGLGRRRPIRGIRRWDIAALPAAAASGETIRLASC
mmetsp:Transcript_17186/g.37090  ORF Transcript_17186/g.37090 Transcript_17186/m.37090 type:complete len:118 (+) Transcript_17186:2525-2878(+)